MSGVRLENSDVFERVGGEAYGRSDESAQMDSKDNGPHYTIQGVLHFLQTEWTRLEMQRSQWEVERAELQARIAFLQGERRGQENLKQDLVRRIKMLEYGLKQERVKFHQYKASIAAGNASPHAVRQSGNQESTNPPTDAKAELATTAATTKTVLEPREKLAQFTEQTLESNVKWRESRLRLKQFLQEVGYADAVLSVREARVRQLLLSAAGWPNESDLPLSGLDSKNKPNFWPFDKAKSKAGDNSNLHDEQAKNALAEIEDAVRSAQDFLSPNDNLGMNNELGDRSTQPDTTGNSLAGCEDNSESYDSSGWVNRFRRTNDTSKRRPQDQSDYVQEDEPNSKNTTSSTTVSSFLNSLGEVGSAGQSKRFGRKHAVDSNILDLINALSDKVDDNDNFLSEINSTAAATAASAAAQNASSAMPNHKLLNTPIQNSSSGTSTFLTDPSISDSTGVGTKGISRLDSGKDASAADRLGLGDLAGLTVINEVDPLLNGEVCDLNTTTLPTSNYDPTISGGHEAHTDVLHGASSTSPLSTGRRPWMPKYTLRGHFDGIRSVAFHPTERAVYTASEDGCVMLWDLLKSGASGTTVSPGKIFGFVAQSAAIDELSPVVVYWGHKGPVLCLAAPSPALAPTLSTTIVYSGGLDGTVRGWRLPSTAVASGSLSSIDLHAPQELDVVTGPVFSSSSSPVWSIALHPSSPLLLAAHANGSIDFWSTVVDSSDNNASPSTPVLSVHLDRLIQPTSNSDQPEFGRPTCLHFLVNRPDSLTASQCVVGTSTGWLVLLDVQTGQVINQIPPPPPLLTKPGEDDPLNLGNIPDTDKCNLPSSDDWTNRAVNALGSHQTLSLVIGAHEDRCVRFYDINRMSDRSLTTNTACVDAMITHLNAVTSLAVDPHGLYLLTGSHDASIRVWDMETHSCVQEMTNHGFKYDESVHSVALHPQLPLAASAGADAICKIYVTAP
ncbi:unnamed protein product [Trichobilharzia szidati]|nr:unnamed protein product [Trichobilharzia szidati]